MDIASWILDDNPFPGILGPRLERHGLASWLGGAGTGWGNRVRQLRLRQVEREREESLGTNIVCLLRWMGIYV